MSFMIHSANILNDTGVAFRRTYASSYAAGEALRAALGWTHLFLGGSYRVDDGFAMDAYQSLREADLSVGAEANLPCVTFTSEVEEDHEGVG